jgi:hypothetical protein
MLGAVRLRGPDEETSYRMTPIKGSHETLDLISIPNVPPLKFGESDVTIVDVVEDG